MNLSRFASMRHIRVLVVLCWIAVPAVGRNGTSGCGTTPEPPKERLCLHRQALRSRKGARPLAVTPSANHDAGNIALIEDADGVVARQNEFNLDRHTLRFLPGAAGYRYEVLESAYDD